MSGRPPRSPNVKLEQLIDERDHIRIQVSLASGGDQTVELRDRLAEIERSIEAFQNAERQYRAGNRTGKRIVWPE